MGENLCQKNKKQKKHLEKKKNIEKKQTKLFGEKNLCKNPWKNPKGQKSLHRKKLKKKKPLKKKRRWKKTLKEETFEKTPKKQKNW